MWGSMLGGLICGSVMVCDPDPGCSFMYAVNRGGAHEDFSPNSGLMSCEIWSLVLPALEWTPFR